MDSNTVVQSHPRQAFTTCEVAVSLLLLAVAMTTTVQVLGWVAAERRAVERRQWAIEEVANLMERLTAVPWHQLTFEKARTFVLSEEVRRKLPEPELSIGVDESQAGHGEKRVAIRLRWRRRGGGWESPVRLTAWRARRRSEQ